MVGHYKKSKFLLNESAREIYCPGTAAGHTSIHQHRLSFDIIYATGKIIVDFHNRKCPPIWTPV
jgi:hypothetical protein